MNWFWHKPKPPPPPAADFTLADIEHLTIPQLKDMRSRRWQELLPPDVNALTRVLAYRAARQAEMHPDILLIDARMRYLRAGGD